MEEKHIAVYVMVRQDELQPEDAGSYDAPLARQKAACLAFLRQKLGDAAAEGAQVYRSRKDLLLDIERQRVSQLVIQSPDRLGSTEGEIEGILFELRMAGVGLMVVTAD